MGQTMLTGPGWVESVRAVCAFAEGELQPRLLAVGLRMPQLARWVGLRARAQAMAQPTSSPHDLTVAVNIAAGVLFDAYEQLARLEGLQAQTGRWWR